MKVIMINGPMGVGKTTVGKYIADKNEGTAFIDGDWCLDLHPFIGNDETKAMAINNILYLIQNYSKCSVCKMIVLVWLMDDEWVYKRIIRGISELKIEIRSVTLICSKEQLIERWKNDKQCEWRTDDWLNSSIESLSHFHKFDFCIDTSNLCPDQVADLIMSE